MNNVVHMENIVKRFGAFTALSNIDFTVQKGHIHALVGENGAGKTTLMKILYGAYHPDEGQLQVEEKSTVFTSTADAILHNVGMVSQHYSIIGDLSCLQNLILGMEPNPLLNAKQLVERAQTLADKMGFQFDWHAAASSLSPAAAQKLEILKLLWRKAHIMILDEPTAMLSPADAEALFKNLRELTQQGATVILVTHRIPEVLEHCDRVTVLRGGKKIIDKDVKNTNDHELAELIVGHSIEQQPRISKRSTEKICSIKNLTVKGERGNHAVKNATLELQQGELVGIAGVDGNGQRELFHAIMGCIPTQEGEIWIQNESITHLQPLERIQRGLRLIPEDRHTEGIVESWSLIENATLGFQRMPELRKGKFRDLKKSLELAQKLSERFQTKHAGLHRPIEHLSGGNQQRFIAARALEFKPKLILAFQPSRGLDINGTAQVYQALREACAQGAAALVVSFDLDELLEECDRIIVMNHGQLLTPNEQQSLDRTAIGRLMVGVV